MRDSFVLKCGRSTVSMARANFRRVQRKFRGILYDSTRPSAYNNPEAAGHNLVIFDAFPSEYNVESVTAVEFGEPDFDPMFSVERWPLRPYQPRSDCALIMALQSWWLLSE